MRSFLLISLAAATLCHAAGPRALTLDEAIVTAQKSNRGLRLARLRVKEMEYRSRGVRADLYPKLSTSGYAMGLLNRQRVAIPAGSLGTYPSTGALPGEEILIDQGSRGLLFTQTTLAQPLTQLWKVREAARIAALDGQIAQVEQQRGENDVRLAVTQIYFGILMAEEQVRAAEAARVAAESAVKEASVAVEASAVLPGVRMQAEALLESARHAKRQAELQGADLRMELNEMLAAPLDTEWTLERPAAPASLPVYEQLLASAYESSEELRSAKASIDKARAAVRLARLDYVPDVSAFVQHAYQAGVPLLARNNGAAGFKVDWTIFDGGKRRSAMQERETAVEQAEENLRRVRDRIAVDLRKAMHKQERLKAQASAAEQALRAKTEADRVAGDQLEAQVSTAAKRAEAAAELARVRAELLVVQMGEHLNSAEVSRIAGLKQ
ncbi:MAG: TolC family protein [Bryobacterales bacterium]|nr:TolC family protein [Bryobacterales bacterium]